MKKSNVKFYSEMSDEEKDECFLEHVCMVLNAIILDSEYSSYELIAEELHQRALLLDGKACPTCEGEGWRSVNTCPDCLGSGHNTHFGEGVMRDPSYDPDDHFHHFRERDYEYYVTELGNLLFGLVSDVEEGFHHYDSEFIGPFTDITSTFLSAVRLREGIACHKCSGVGSIVYGDTSTWRGGCGGQSMTTGPCDFCWGSGRNDFHWENLRLRATFNRPEWIIVRTLRANDGKATFKTLDKALQEVHEESYGDTVKFDTSSKRYIEDLANDRKALIFDDEEVTLKPKPWRKKGVK